MRHAMSFVNSLSIVLHTLMIIHVTKVGHSVILGGGGRLLSLDTANRCQRCVIHQLKHADA